MQKLQGYRLISLLISALILFSCRKESTYWEADYVAPLAQGNLTLASMFPDTTIKSNPDSSLKIEFDASVVNFGIDSLLKIPDTTIVSAFTFTTPIVIPISPGTTFPGPTSPEEYHDLPNGVQLSSATIRQGKVKIKISNTVHQPLTYHYQFTSATKNNFPLDTTFDIPGRSGTTPGSTTVILDLSGYKIDFTGANHNKTNTTIQNYTVTVASYAQNDSLHPNEGFSDSVTFMGIVPQYAQGYFGSQLVTVGPDTTTFDVFKTIKSGLLNLNSATVQLKVINEFGVDMRASLNNLTAISTGNHTVVTINGSNSTPLASPLNINAAVNTGSGAIASTKTLTLNNTNTPSLTSFIGILPDKFAYKLSTQLNPNGNLGGTNDFAYYGTGFKAYLSADIPLYFSASNIQLADTVALNLSGVNQFKNINHGQLTLTATNSYPFSINLQGYLLDENKNTIDVLFDSPNVVNSPPLDANLKVIAPLQSKLIAPLSRSKMDNLQKAKYIYYSATFNTASQPSLIKFYSNYTLGLLLTADINYTVGK